MDGLLRGRARLRSLRPLRGRDLGCGPCGRSEDLFIALVLIVAVTTMVAALHVTVVGS